MGMKKRPVITLIVFSVVLLAVYAFSRLVNLSQFPIFTDEAIYIRWSQIGSRDASWRFISLVDGKQPMFTWIMMVLMRFVRDPLIAGRLVSVIAGSMGCVGLWFLAREITKSTRAAYIASMVYILCPFTLMYDRLALYDALVAAFSVWSLYLGILLMRKGRLDIALLYGMTLGAGMLNKTSGFLSLYMAPMLFILFDWSRKKRWARFFRTLALFFISALLSQMIYSILRLSPLFSMVGQKDTVFVYPFREWLSHPFQFLRGNLNGLFDWLLGYLTIPAFITAFIPFIDIKNRLKEKVLLFAWFLAPMIGLAMFGKVLYPRFILFMAMPLLVLISDGLLYLTKRIQNRGIMIGLCLILIYPWVRTDYYILTDPVSAAIPKADKGQMLNDWPAGGGAKEIVRFFREEAEKGPIAVFTEGTFGLLPYVLEIYLVDHPNITIRGIYPIPNSIPDYITSSASEKPTYFIANYTQTDISWPMMLITKYQKGSNGSSFMRLYRINLQKD